MQMIGRKPWNDGEMIRKWWKNPEMMKIMKGKRRMKDNNPALKIGNYKWKYQQQIHHYYVNITIVIYAVKYLELVAT